MDDRRTQPTGSDDTPPLRGATPAEGQPEQGDTQDVPAERIYPTNPTGADPT
jgi:hypothetical protein